MQHDLINTFITNACDLVGLSSAHSLVTRLISDKMYGEVATVLTVALYSDDHKEWNSGSVYTVSQKA